MNARNILLGAGGLAAAFFLGFLAAPRQAPVPSVPAPAPATTPIAVRAAEKKPRTTVLTNTVTQRIDWRAVESEDYKNYIANLRAIGCPEETIRDIIVADVNKLFEARRKEKTVKQEPKKYEFWKSGNGLQDFVPDPEQLAQAQADAKERRALLMELLGYAPVEKVDFLAIVTGGVNPFGAMLDFLDPSKQTQVMEVMFKFQAIKENKDKNKFATDAEAVAAARKIIKDRESELAQLLTPQEQEQFHLNLSDLADSMRDRAEHFDFTEEEFRSIFRIRKQSADEFAPLLESKNPEDRNKHKAAMAEDQRQIQVLLGDARYAEYKRAGDWAYHSIADFAESQKIPKEAGVKVYDIMKVAEEQAGKVRGDQTLSSEQRADTLTAIRAETERAVAQTMGQKAYELYQKANWIKNLNAPPKP